jgi:APA family basic amino acid/polyamine antiporter
MPNLLAKKPLSALLSEAKQQGEHSLERCLGPFSLTALGVWAR